MRKLLKLTIRCSLALLACATAAPGWTLPTDRDQPIAIASDRAERDEKTGTTIYIGTVELDQGSLHISADRLEIQMEGDRVTRMVATGIPARVRQLPNQEDGEVRAQANTIRYLLDEEKLELIDNASIEQEGSRVASDRIDYFINEEFVKARSTSGQSGRVHVVIPSNRASNLGKNARDSGANADTGTPGAPPPPANTAPAAAPPSAAAPAASPAAEPQPAASAPGDGGA